MAAEIWQALGDAQTVLNVGAGTGSYEPPDRWVLAVEPSSAMIAQRPNGAAPVLQAAVEDLPLADQTIDAAMAILTLHHWDSVETGLRELLRVARKRIVLVTMEVSEDLWIVRDYLAELLGQHAARFPSIERLREHLPHPEVRVLPVPRDCHDGFMAAFWARPEAYLDPTTRAATSPWHDLPPTVTVAANTATIATSSSRRPGTSLGRPPAKAWAIVIVGGTSMGTLSSRQPLTPRLSPQEIEDPGVTRPPPSLAPCGHGRQ